MSRSESQPLDLSAYLRRIEYRGELEATHAVLEALHLAHVSHIPFENLDILLGRPILLGLDSLQAKLVDGKRGGYCFEQNLLFAAVLEVIGFPVKRLAARVRPPDKRLLPRTHMTLLVTIGKDTWLADVGFGADGPLLPVPFGSGQSSQQFTKTYRVIEETDCRVLQSLHEQGWVDLYAFTLEPQELIDYELANFFTSTHPKSPFVQSLTAQLVTPEARMILRNMEYTLDQGTTVTKRILKNDEELLDLLEGTFGLCFPEGTRFNPRQA